MTETDVVIENNKAFDVPPEKGGGNFSDLKWLQTHLIRIVAALGATKPNPFPNSKHRPVLNKVI